MARSCWAEQVVNLLFKACAIAFRLDWAFPSKATEIFGGRFNLLPADQREALHTLSYSIMFTCTKHDGIAQCVQCFSLIGSEAIMSF